MHVSVCLWAWYHSFLISSWSCLSGFVVVVLLMVFILTVSWILREKTLYEELVDTCAVEPGNKNLNDLSKNITQSTFIIFCLLACFFTDTKVWWSQWNHTVCSRIVVWEELHRALSSGRATKYSTVSQTNSRHFGKHNGTLTLIVFLVSSTTWNHQHEHMEDKGNIFSMPCNCLLLKFNFEKFSCWLTLARGLDSALVVWKVRFSLLTDQEKGETVMQCLSLSFLCPSPLVLLIGEQNRTHFLVSFIWDPHNLLFSSCT